MKVRDQIKELINSHPKTKDLTPQQKMRVEERLMGKAKTMATKRHFLKKDQPPILNESFKRKTTLREKFHKVIIVVVFFAIILLFGGGYYGC